MPQIIHLTVTAGHAELADLAALALTLAPQPRQAATLASQQVTHERASTDKGPDANRLAMSLNNQSVQRAGLGRREDALAAIEEATGLRRKLNLAAKWPDAYRQDLDQSLRVAEWLRQSEDLHGTSPHEQ